MTPATPHPDSPVQALLQAHHRGQPVGLASVCCSNDLVLQAAMQVARRYGTPLLVEATSNQVDQFGGYTGMTPAQYHAHVLALARAEGFPAGQLILGGDHLGPNAWQHLPAREAMVHAEALIAAYVSAGFHKIHLDCSMACADDPTPLPDERVAERSARLARVAEVAAARAGLPPPVYVIGTEVPIPGGEIPQPGADAPGAGAATATALDTGLAVTRPEAAARTLAVHRQAFDEPALHGAWQRVVALVVQPGVDFDHSHIHPYDPAAAAALSAFITQDRGEGQPALVFEAHSTDYQTEAALHALVRDHFAILKVGPAATYALREALFALAAMERELLPVEQRSHLVEVLERCMLEQPRHWLKHYPGNATHQRLLRQFALSDRCRYYWGEPPVREALARLMDNLGRHAPPLTLLSQFMPEQYEEVLLGRLAATPQALARHKVGLVLARYARACAHNEAPVPSSESSDALELSRP